MMITPFTSGLVSDAWRCGNSHTRPVLANSYRMNRVDLSHTASVQFANHNSGIHGLSLSHSVGQICFAVAGVSA